LEGFVEMRFDWRLRSGIAGPANFVAMLAVLSVFPLILRWTGALSVANVSPESPEHSQAFLKFCFVLTGFLWLIFCIALVGIRQCGKITWRQLIGTEMRGWRSVAGHLGVAIAAFVGMAAIGNLSNSILGPLQHDRAVFQSMIAKSGVEALAFLVLAISAGFVEEFVFRGYIQRQCHALCGNTALAAFLQIAIFTQGHFYQGWLRLVPVMLIGLVLTITALWRKSLVPGMIAHGFGDGLVSFMFFFKHL
jgi:membrane protease YdiL (CAAX protease family)